LRDCVRIVRTGCSHVLFDHREYRGAADPAQAFPGRRARGAGACCAGQDRAGVLAGFLLSGRKVCSVGRRALRQRAESVVSYLLQGP
jgi:hypothetical protein